MPSVMIESSAFMSSRGVEARQSPERRAHEPRAIAVPDPVVVAHGCAG